MNFINIISAAFPFLFPFSFPSPFSCTSPHAYELHWHPFLSHSMSGGPLLLFLESPNDIKVVTTMVDSPLTHHSTLLWTFIDICSIYSHSHSMLDGLLFVLGSSTWLLNW
jgi:hypothetical protein